MAAIKCPTCGESFLATDEPHMPFCSRRCQQIDMQRWLSEEQGLPIEEEGDSFDRESMDSPDDEDEGPARFAVDRN